MSDMKRVTSSYKLRGGFGQLIYLNGLAGVLAGIWFTIIDFVDLMNSTSAQVASVCAVGLNLAFLTCFATQCRSIVVDEEGITFINPLFPLLRSRYQWTYFDYCVTVEEYSRYETHAAIWFVKDDRINKRISSYYYSNYLDMIEQVKTEYKGERSYSRFAQELIWLRLRGVAER